MKKRFMATLPFLLVLLMITVGMIAQESPMEGLFLRLGRAPAVAGLYGEYWGKTIGMWLLGAAPIVLFLSYLLDRIRSAAGERIKEEKPPEFAGVEERRAHYLNELSAQENRTRTRIPTVAYHLTIGILLALYAVLVIGMRLPDKVQAIREDLDRYEANDPAVYTGMLRQVDRPVVDGAKRVPDPYYVYYKGEESAYFRCARDLLSETQLMQEAYTVTYLPNSITVLSITDGEGVVRTEGAQIELPVPEHHWRYGDLAIPICDQVEGYEQLTFGGQRAFDLLYSQVFSGRVDRGEARTRSFELAEPIPAQEFRAVLDLYEASGCLERYPNFKYRTDDSGTVSVAYCQRIIRTGGGSGSGIVIIPN